MDRIVSIVYVLKDLRKDAFSVAPNSNSKSKEFTVGINIREVSSKDTSVDSIFLFVSPHLEIYDWGIKVTRRLSV